MEHAFTKILILRVVTEFTDNIGSQMKMTAFSPSKLPIKVSMF